MPHVPVEICIHSRSRAAVEAAVGAAYHGGADRVELCAGMDVGGLTPPVEHVQAARVAFRDRPGLIVMVRPHGGGFAYTAAEVELMARQGRAAAEAGADGVALGALTASGAVDERAVTRLVAVATENGLAVTFHRALDATPDPAAAAAALARRGVRRLLTSGTPWGSPGTAVDGLDVLATTIRRVEGRAEVVVGGGVRAGTVGGLLRALPGLTNVSVHAYSGAQRQGRTDGAAVRALVRAVRQAASGAANDALTDSDEHRPGGARTTPGR